MTKQQDLLLKALHDILDGGEKTVFTMSMLQKLFDEGVITEKLALQFVIKNQYFHLMKHTDISGRSAIIDLSIEWCVTEYFVRNLIYNLRPAKPTKIE